MRNTIGDWLPNIKATLCVKPFWTVARDRCGTHAVIDVCVLLKKAETVIGIVRLGIVARGADYPDAASWMPGSMPAVEAVRLVAEIAKRDYAWLDAQSFAGVNCALPWEVPQPNPPFWRRLIAWLCFWRKRG